MIVVICAHIWWTVCTPKTIVTPHVLDKSRFVGMLHRRERLFHASPDLKLCPTSQLAKTKWFHMTSAHHHVLIVVFAVLIVVFAVKSQSTSGISQHVKPTSEAGFHASSDLRLCLTLQFVFFLLEGLVASGVPTTMILCLTLTGCFQLH